jgi:hypothetical protein
MKPNTALKTAPDGAQRTKPPARSPERQHLSDCISRRTAAEQAHEAGTRAAARARDAVVKAEAAVEAARAGVVEAGDQRASELALAASGGKPATSNATRWARTALDAEHELAAATSAHAKLKVNLGDLEDAALDASNRVTAAVDVLLRASAEPALAEAEGLALRLRELVPTLWFFLRPEMDEAMVGRPISSPFSTDWDAEARHLGRERANRRAYAASDALGARNAGFSEVGKAITRFLERPPHLDNGWNWYKHPALAAWRAAREALHHDADAPVPPV